MKKEQAKKALERAFFIGTFFALTDMCIKAQCNFAKTKEGKEMPTKRRTGIFFAVSASAGAFVTFTRANQLYGQGTIENISAVFYFGIFVLCILVVVRESIWFLKEKGALPKTS